MSNPVFDGLAEGLKPSRDTISSTDAALLAIGAKLDHLTEAANRQADAMETFVALFASVIGQAYAWCPGEADASPVVNYIRSGTGETFKCDKEASDD